MPAPWSCPTTTCSYRCALDSEMNGRLSVTAEPYDFVFEPSRAGLLVIDMQRDFVERGGFGEMLGNDVTPLRQAVEPDPRVKGVPYTKGRL